MVPSRSAPWRWFLAAAILGASIVPAPAHAVVQMVTAESQSIRLVVNGQPFHADPAPYLVDGRLVIPMRAMAEALGARVDWNAANNRALAMIPSTVIEFTVDRTEAIVNGHPVQLVTAPRQASGRMMVPLRFLVETLGGTVQWDGPTRTVSVSLTGGTTQWPTNWNGKAVYLSPAHHTPENTGCGNYRESDGARAIAVRAKDDLLAMGYAVRVGAGDYISNTRDSNRWGSDVHLPIHSNAAASSDGWDCAGDHANHGGTWLMYAFDSDYRVATNVFARMKNVTAGTNDRMGSDTDLSGKSLFELRQTQMPAAYVEAAFHTYGPEVDWLRQATEAGEQLALGVDDYFDSPRCTANCPNRPTKISHGKAEEKELHPDPAATNHVITVADQRFAKLYKAVGTLLTGRVPAPVHAATPSIFSAKTSGNLREAVLVGDMAVVNFTDFASLVPNGSTSAGKAQLLAELNDVVFKFGNVNAVQYQFDGSCDRFWTWLEGSCSVITRSEWTGQHNHEADR